SALFSGCNTTRPRYVITYTKQYPGATSSVELAEGVQVWSGCKISPHLGSGSVYADLHKLGEINGKLTKAGKVVHGRLDAGCTGTVSLEPMKFQGKAVLKFDKTKLGIVNLTKATAQVRRTNESCNGITGPTPTK